MNNKKYQNILYLIVLVIVATVALQGYWNYKNYQLNKQQLITDVQTSLDKVVDDYYSELAHNTTLGLTFDKLKSKNVLRKGGLLESISKSIDDNDATFKGLDSLKLESIKGDNVFRGLKADSLMNKKRFSLWTKDSTKKKHDLIVLKGDSLSKKNPFEFLTSKVVISISNDSLNVKKIDSLFNKSLLSKNIDLQYNLIYNKPKVRFPKLIENTTKSKTLSTDSIQNTSKITVSSKSTFLPKGSALSVQFENANWVAFKKGIIAIIISIILVLAVVGCLFFLLNIIRNQKQLAEIKNDFISNITHEFKTPISTIGVALEGINNFNVINDQEKTKNYVAMSAEQLSKLNIMVEKLLETATLDNASLKLNKEDLNITQLLDDLTERYKAQHQQKTFHLNIEDTDLVVKADPFHFENALNNIFDNAVKYGGEVILVSAKRKKNSVEIHISDNGNALKPENKQHIFEKFYRVPQGNTHNIKGYGIGLFYTKTIVNKHNGTIHLNLDNNLTTFKITLPNG